MKKKNEQGYAIIMLLVLTAALMISLTASISMLSALRRQNRQAKIELKKQEQIINVKSKK